MPQLLADRTWLWISAVFYATAFLSVTFTLLKHRRRPRLLVFALIALGLVAQTVALHQRGMSSNPPGCPLHNTFEVVQFVIWSFTVLYAIVGTAFRVSVLGYFTSGLAAALSVASLIFWYQPVGASVTKPFFSADPWIEVHASLALFAYGAFGTLALTSLMFLLQTFSLKRKHLRGVFSLLPPIVALESINFRLLLTGLTVLSGSILVASIHGRETGTVGTLDLLIFGGVWLAYVIVLVLRLRRLLVAKSLAWTCVALFGLALLSLSAIESHRRAPAQPPSYVSRLVVP